MLAAPAGLLLLAALITAVLWRLALNRRQSFTTRAAARAAILESSTTGSGSTPRWVTSHRWTSRTKTTKTQTLSLSSLSAKLE